MGFISAISISAALMWVAAYANPLPQGNEARSLSQANSGRGIDIITEIDWVAARGQLQEVDARVLEARDDTGSGSGFCVIA